MTMVAAAAVGALAVGVYSADQQGKAAGRAGANAKEAAYMGAINSGKEAGARMYEAEQIREHGQLQAQKLLAQSRQFRQTQQTVAAASGFVVDSGTMADLQQLTDNLAKADAYAMLLDSTQSAVTNEISAKNLIDTGASGSAMQYKNDAAQVDAMYAQSTATLLSSFSNFAGSKYGQQTGTKIMNSWGM